MIFLALIVYGCQKDVEYKLRVTVTPENGGTVDLNPSGGIYPEGTVVSLQVNPASGYVFSSWTGTDVSSVQSDKITMTKNMDITCNFIKSAAEIRLKSSDMQINGVKVNFLAISQSINYLNFTSVQVTSFSVSQAEWYLLGGTCPFETSYKPLNLQPGLSYFFLSTSDVIVVGSFLLKEGKSTFWLNYDYATGRSKSNITQP
jgi:uncharacterized repeat protein (TIGR02543 family)